MMITPLMARGRVTGVTYLDSKAAKGIFTTDDVDLLATILGQLALFMQTARTVQLELAVQTAQRERDTAELLRGAMSDLTASLDPAEVAGRLTTAVAQALPATQAYLLHRDEYGSLTLATHPTDETTTNDTPIDYPDELRAAWRPLDPAGDEVLSELLTADRPRRENTDRRPLPLPGVLSPATRAWLAVRGSSRGLLLAATDGRPYTDAEAEVAAALAGLGMAALDNALLFGQMNTLATIDGLTGLHNRRHFLETSETQLVSCRRHTAPIAAIMIDIDHFKKINDTYGHGVGDEVITEIGRRLAAAVRGTDLICRYGGEEFAILMPDTSESAAVTTADRLRRTVNATAVSTAAGPLPVTISVGLSTRCYA